MKTCFFLLLPFARLGFAGDPAAAHCPCRLASMLWARSASANNILLAHCGCLGTMSTFPSSGFSRSSSILPTATLVVPRNFIANWVEHSRLNPPYEYLLNRHREKCLTAGNTGLISLCQIIEGRRN